ncbi:SGNH hydrolase [Punctularia strigosozonata HHB-11173 SS5]|uniref:SGNH hydrolase n=1 Tax=Punctularia strigosozonata (strain HHB-11173) TaxID=741275 RepID=UPI00044185A5|nr:SGNH hydrolase [Punctularia strigosozonata HHB-11173 SS5]EIN07808.1 SGNH hydrolase [Punctularia strigosozonata HHB-11173 SS5]
MDQIWLLGDSLTQGGYEPEQHGFVARLSHVYNRKFDVVNRGFSGYTTRWILPVFKQVWPLATVSRPKIHILGIWFGANDAALRPPQHVPLPEFMANLKELATMVKDPESEYYSPDTHVLFITPPPVNTHQRFADLSTRGPAKELDRSFEQTKTYAKAVKEVGYSLQAPVVDVWTELWNAAGQKEEALSAYLTDGLHLNGAGYDILYKLILDTIGSELTRYHPDRLQMVFAPYVSCDPSCPDFMLTIVWVGGVRLTLMTWKDL